MQEQRMKLEKRSTNKSITDSNNNHTYFVRDTGPKVPVLFRSAKVKVSI